MAKYGGWGIIANSFSVVLKRLMQFFAGSYSVKSVTITV